MATFKFFPALAGKTITELMDDASFRPEAEHAQTMTFKDKNDIVITLEGKDFQYSQGTVTGGEVNSVLMRDKDGHTLETISGLNLAAADVYDNFHSYGTSALIFTFNGFFDTLKGSKKNDILDGGAGDDHISGSKGSDQIIGGTGNDVLSGGGGADNFYFKDGAQSDTVTDFSSQGKHHDRVELTQGMYDRVEMHQHGENLILDFGWGDELTLQHVQKADFGKDDFLIIA
jgi:Ca2+-binding RTX toxin-like protein